MIKHNLIGSLVLPVALMGLIQVQAAVPRKVPVALGDILVLPKEPRQEILKGIGPKVFPKLVTKIFDEQATVSQRWSAMNSLVELSPGPATEQVIETCLKNKNWALRNAGLFAMVQLNKTKAEHWALQLLTDRSLIVRTAAVETLRNVKAVNRNRDRLWKELENPLNYRLGKSLWIRKTLLKALSEVPVVEDLTRFQRLSKDDDDRLHPFAESAVQSIARNVASSR